MGLIFGARIYCRSQALLFSSYDLNLSVVENSALIMGCVLMIVGYVRHGFGEIDIYPSRTVLQGSVVVLLVGLYLFVVGVLAQLARIFGGTGNFQLQALVVLAGVVGLAVLLLVGAVASEAAGLCQPSFSPTAARLPGGVDAVHAAAVDRAQPEAYHLEAVRLVAGTFNALVGDAVVVRRPARAGCVLGRRRTARQDEEDEEAGR